jgi:hypothetical protein
VLAFDIALWRLFTVPEGGELSIGIFLGLLAAGAIAVGGYMTLQEDGNDPLGVGGGDPGTATTRVASTPATASRTGGSTRTTSAKKPAAKGARKPAAKRTAKR